MPCGKPSRRRPPFVTHLGSAPLIESLYEAENTHWWSVGMRGVTHTFLQGNALPSGPILEVGCGGGAFLTELKAHHPARTILGIDTNPTALGLSKQSYGEDRSLAQANLHYLPFPDSKLGTLVGLDVYDQTGVELASALAESWRVLRPGSVLLVRVSAYDWLWGNHDRAFGTAQRYTKARLECALQAANYTIIRMTYANALMLVPAILHRLASKPGWISVEQQFALPDWLNGLLKLILRLEALWLRRSTLPVGLSLYALAKKN